MYDEQLEERSSTRTSIWWKALVYVPGSAITTGLFVFALGGLLGGNAGAIFPVFLLGIIGFALLYEAVAAVRDLRAEPVVTRGEIQRIWKKSRLLMFGRQDYLLVAGKVFEVGPLAATELSVGDLTAIEHWPHTMRVVSVQRVRGDQTTGAMPRSQ